MEEVKAHLELRSKVSDLVSSMSKEFFFPDLLFLVPDQKSCTPECRDHGKFTNPFVVNEKCFNHLGQKEFVNLLLDSKWKKIILSHDKEKEINAMNPEFDHTTFNDSWYVLYFVLWLHKYH